MLGGKAFEQEEFRRRLPVRTGEHSVWVATPEDLILSKLDWYRLGGESSERQWRDVISLLQLHGQQLDRTYLDLWVQQLRLSELWERVCSAL